MPSSKPIDFIIIGAAKSGTTSLANQLAQHPQIRFCKRKEPEFFSHAGPDWRSRLDDYHALFPSSSPTQSERVLRGEASVSYTAFPQFPETPSRLREYNPDLRLIYVMRDPVERLRSHYAFDTSRGINLASSPRDAFLIYPALLYRGLYGLQLSRYFTHFPREQILLLVFEEYRRDPVAALRSVSEFLDIESEPCGRIDLTPQNVTTHGDYLRPLGRRIASQSLFRRARPWIPAALRRLAKTAATRGAAPKPDFDDEFGRDLRDFYDKDARWVSDLVGRPLWWL